MRLLHEPLLHFLLLGGVLFAAYSLFAADDAEATDRIVVTQGRIEHLATTFARTWQRSPSPRELQGLVEDYVREEVFYREALAIGLDRDDTVIRRRLRQKLEFLAADLMDRAEPTEDALQTFLDQHADSFRLDAKSTFVHVYLDPDRRGDGLTGDAQRLLGELNRAGVEADPETMGDPFLLPRRYEEVTDTEIGHIFGAGFAAGLRGLAPGRWHGPVESGFGVHLVAVLARSEGRLPSLDEAREAVLRECSAAARREQKEAFYQRLREGYEVVIEAPEEPGK